MVIKKEGARSKMAFCPIWHPIYLNITVTTQTIYTHIHVFGTYMYCNDKNDYFTACSCIRGNNINQCILYVLASVAQAHLALEVDCGSSLKKHFTHSNMTFKGGTNQWSFTVFIILHNEIVCHHGPTQGERDPDPYCDKHIHPSSTGISCP